LSLDLLGEALLQSPDVQLAVEPHADGHVVEGAASLHLVEEPEPLLRIGHHLTSAISRYSSQRRLCVQPYALPQQFVYDLPQPVYSRLFKQTPQTNIYSECRPQSRCQLSR